MEKDAQIIQLDQYRDKRYQRYSDEELAAEYSRLEVLKHEHLDIALRSSIDQAIIAEEASRRDGGGDVA